MLARIKPRHIQLSLRNDEELSSVIGPNVMIPMSGVVPFIHPDIILQGKKRKADKREFIEEEAEEE